jgi:aspartate-semialdehyde dehydrogenase
VQAVSPEGFEGVDIALFAGTEGEKGAAVTFASEAVKRGAIVIDNGADFRMQPDVPLVVPEVNAKASKKHKGIIANPNCSTIQMVVALWPIHKLAKIKRIVVATYQAASGAGREAVKQLYEETRAVLEGRDLPSEKALPQRIAFNVFPHIGGFAEEGYTSEEWKMVRETHKIFDDKSIKISATTVRVPVAQGHSEAVYIETAKNITVEKIRSLLKKHPGVIVIDDVKNAKYPLPIDAANRDEVFVGRIRKDPFVKNAFWLWIVSDNLLKGAATNAVQIAQQLIK